MINQTTQRPITTTCARASLEKRTQRRAGGEAAGGVCAYVKRMLIYVCGRKTRLPFNRSVSMHKMRSGGKFLDAIESSSYLQINAMKIKLGHIRYSVRQ